MQSTVPSDMNELNLFSEREHNVIKQLEMVS